MRYVLTMMLLGAVACDEAVHRDALFTGLTYTDSGYTPATPGDFQGNLTLGKNQQCRLANGLQAPPCQLTANAFISENLQEDCDAKTVLDVQAIMDVKALDFNGEFTLASETTRPAPGEGAMRVAVNGRWSVSTTGGATLRVYPLLDNLVEITFFPDAMIDEKTKAKTANVVGQIYCKLPKSAP